MTTRDAMIFLARIARHAIALALAFAVWPLPAHARPHAEAKTCGTTVLYDGALGTLPAAQGLNYLAFAISATQTLSGNATLLDTFARQADQAGYFGDAALVPSLDRARGFTLTFAMQVLDEAHASAHRAGTSVIVLGSDKLGVELGFWRDHVWAQEGGSPPSLFTHAEDAAFTTTTLLSYALGFGGAQYRLSANGAHVLSGTARDYTAFSGFPDPYETPNLIFIGDDTGSARAKALIARVAIELPRCLVFVPVTMRDAGFGF